MEQTYDYRYRLTVPGGHSTFRIRIFEDAPGGILCLATQRHAMIGIPALAERTDALATQVAAWHHPARDGKFTWIEQEEYPSGDGPGGARESFELVSFGAGGGDLQEHGRRALSRSAVEVLLGRSIAN